MANPPVQSTNKDCDVCAKLRPISLHLHELSKFSEFLSNEAYSKFKKRNVTTSKISQWIKLSGELKTVELNKFEYELASGYCESIGDYLDDEAKHQKSFLIPLTKFLFLINALEEACLFVDPIFTKNSYKIEYSSSPYKRAEKVIVEIGENYMPLHLEHFIEKNYRIRLDRFIKDHPAVEKEFRQILDCYYSNGLGLNMLRAIRNVIVHGAFPLTESPDYDFNKKYSAHKNLVQTLHLSIRIAAIYIQCLLAIGNKGFKGIGYQFYCESTEDGYFEQHCNVNYLQNLHLIQEFEMTEIHLWTR